MFVHVTNKDAGAIMQKGGNGDCAGNLSTIGEL
jgi:hypothetical protein